MRVVGSRVQYRISSQPSGDALKAGAAFQEVGLALAAVATTGIAVGVYRFKSLAEADAHAAAGQARAIAENARRQSTAG